MNKEKIAEIVRNNSVYYLNSKQHAIFYNVKPYLHDGPERYYGPQEDLFLEADTRDELTEFLIAALGLIMDSTPLEKYEIDDEAAILEQGILLFDNEGYHIYIEGDTVFELLLQCLG